MWTEQGVRPGRRSVRKRVAAGWAVLAGAVVLLAGCASMPTSGAVREAAAGSAAEQPGSGLEVRVFANPPQPGMAPSQIVTGFLDAMNSVEPNFAIARKYLAAPNDWDPGEGVRVYDENEREVRANPVGTGYVLETVLVGDVARDGRYRPAIPGSPLTVQFDVRKVNGEWRVDHPPSGVLLANLDFTREYVSTEEPIALYFFDPSYRVLVPDPIYLPKRSDRLTAVTEAVLRGPTDRLAEAVASAVPTGTRLASTPVTAVNGQITVRLDRTAARLDEAQRRLLTAQLVWSLSGVSEGASVVVTADGVPLYPRPTTPADWELYRPFAPNADSKRVYFLRDGALMTYDRVPGAQPQRVPAGAGGQRLQRLAAFAVSPSTRDVAGVTQDQSRLIKIRLDLTRERPESLHRGSKLDSPSWDRFGGLWVVESGSRVYLFDESGRHDVVVDKLGDRKIKSLAVSSDGTRVAMITKLPNEEARLELGLVRTGAIEPGSPDPRRRVGPVSIVGLQPLAPQLDEAVDVSWVDPQRLVVLIRDAEADVQPFEVGVDGRMPELLGGPMTGDPVTVAAGGTDVPILVGTSDEKIWELSTSTGPSPIRLWGPLGDGAAEIRGSSPAYPG
ncbi:MAG TPA: LpqB family beta-propeller domain-containing protein [Actinomycetes bacterium]|nr:LpqB family beta-propeller domain-containing protein [Actinomycetes bacterium]